MSHHPTPSTNLANTPSASPSSPLFPSLQAIGPVAQVHVLCESYPWQVNGPLLVQHLIWEMEAFGL